VLSGISAQIPVVVTIDPIAERHEPNNRTITLVDKWNSIGSSDFDWADDLGQIEDDFLATADEPPF
jgi:hypothetical protein